MLVSRFRSNRPAILLALVLLVPGLFLAGWWRSAMLPGPSMEFYAWVASLQGPAPWAAGVIRMVVIALMAVQITFLVNDAELMDRRTHLPALLFPILLGAMSGTMALEPALLGMPLVIAAMSRCWSIVSSKRALAALFDAGLLIGIAALCYLPYAFLVVVIWASISVIRPFQLREYLLPMLGVALPLYLTWAFGVLLGHDAWRPLFTIVAETPVDQVPAALPRWLDVLLILDLVGLVLAALIGFLGNYQRGVMREKNMRASFMAFFFALGVVIAFVRFLNGSFPSILLAAPLAVFCSHALLSQRRAWLSELAMLVLLVVALWRQWG